MFLLYHVENHRLDGTIVDVDKAAYQEPPHPGLRYLQIQLFLFLVLSELNHKKLLRKIQSNSHSTPN